MNICPRYKIKLIKPLLERAKVLQNIDKVNQPLFMQLSGLGYNRSLEFGLSGVKEALTDFNAVMRFNKNTKAVFCFFRQGLL
jgi:hypothetical protein